MNVVADAAHDHLTVRAGPAEVRTWIEKMIKALRFIELVVAVLALIRRMREINLALMTQIVHFRRARPRSETMRRLEAQCVLPS